MPLDCDNNNLTNEQILGAVIATALSDGACALRFLPVTDGGGSWADCDSNNQDLDQLIKRLIGVDVNGNLGIRVIEVTDSGDQCLDCTNQNIPLQDILTYSVIGMGDDGHPALRIATL